MLPRTALAALEAVCTEFGKNFRTNGQKTI